MLEAERDRLEHEETAAGHDSAVAVGPPSDHDHAPADPERDDLEEPVAPA